MTRTTAGVLALGTALALTGCSSHSSGASPAAGTTTPVATTAAGSTGPAASTAPVATGPASVSASATASATAAAAASASASATSTTSPAPTTSASGSTRCLNAHLTVTLKAGSPGAGQIYTEIVFTNTGAATCTLAGHPGVSYVAGDDGHQVGASATREGTAITTVTLAPGGTASALLHETNYQNFDPATCKAVEIRGLRVYPPGSTAAVFLARPGKQCSATSLPDPALSIAVVKAGTGD